MLKNQKLGKINMCICELISDFANSELIQAPYKTSCLLSHQYFHTLGNLLDKDTPIHERINIEIFGSKETQTRKGVAKG